MDVPSPELYSESQADKHPLLMERMTNPSGCEHIIDVSSSADASATTSYDRTSSSTDTSSLEERYSSSSRTPVSQPLPSSNGANTTSGNSSSARRGESRRRRSPLNSGLWISVELVLTLSQIVASIVVLSVSRNEHPRAPLFAWIVGYAAGCVATLPFLYWRYRGRNQALDQESSQHRQNSTHINVPAGPFSLSVSRTSDGEDHRPAVTSPRGGQNTAVNARLKVLVEYIKMALDCFFAVWFVVGNVWIFGGHSSADEAPNLYGLCIVFLTFSCIGYAMPFILCATICCCLPCIISILGFQEDPAQTKGATPESINALPTYKFKSKKHRDGDHNSVSDGGSVAAGTEKERVISGEDAVCCICLAKYANNDELRELPCSHLLHKDCVDKWLKINATCPLCKSEVGESVAGGLLPGSGSGHRRVENNRVGNGVPGTLF